MRKALIVGIDYYDDEDNRLYGCVNDAVSVSDALARHSDGTINFSIKLVTGKNSLTKVKGGDLKDMIKDLFSGDSDIALFYFAGHGCIDSTGGYLVPSDSKRGDDGISLNNIMSFANKSKSKNRIIILDSCHSGIVGDSPIKDVSELSEGVTILTASTKEQYSSEVNGKGVFTELLVDALGGAAANLVGDITPGSVYAHIDQSLGPWEQRPVFKTNIKQFVSLKKAQPPINIEDLQKITSFFPKSGYEFKLDPTFEPELRGRGQADPLPIRENIEVFKVLQKYNRINLLIPVDCHHMWSAAMERKGCRLTVLGEHYRKLVERGKI